MLIKKKWQNILNGTDNMKNVDSNFEDKFWRQQNNFGDGFFHLCFTKLLSQKAWHISYYQRILINQFLLQFYLKEPSY